MTKPINGPYDLRLIKHDGLVYGFDIIAPTEWGTQFPLASFYTDPPMARRLGRAPDEIAATGRLFELSPDLLGFAITAQAVCQETADALERNDVPEAMIKLLLTTARMARMLVRRIEEGATVTPLKAPNGLHGAGE